MPRPFKCRRIGIDPAVTAFKPARIPASQLAQTELGLDELEALRLADLLGLYQDEAARRMGVSRATFGRIVAEARRKVAEALIEGRMLLVQGGEVVHGRSETTPPRGRCRRRAGKGRNCSS